MIGNALASFAMSLFVLDYTGSTLYYAVYLFLYTLPQIMAPAIAGPIMDRFSRRRTIYFLDFATAALYLFLAAAVKFEFMSFGVFAVAVFLSGTIYSSYLVAYESFFPMLISEGNFSAGYSIASVLETASTVMVVVSTYIYNAVGLFPIMVINASCFLVAALFEMNISDVEKAMGFRSESRYSVRKFVDDTKEGVRYLVSEKGLFYITVYFICCYFVGGVTQVITLPWFRGSYENGEYVYMSVWGFMVVGRVIGGLLHYKFNLPDRYKFLIALFVYVSIDAIEGVYLFLPLEIMRILCFLDGILGVTSYNIRISATQSYVPNERKGRFNGAFIMLTTIGTLLGQLAAGIMSEVMLPRAVIVITMAAGIIAALTIIGGHRKDVEIIYNRTA